MKGRFIANLLAIFVPSKRLRHKLRKWQGFKTRSDQTAQEITKIYQMSRLAIPVCTIPPAQGLMRGIQLLLVEKLKKISEIFNQNSIDYWLDFGSLLGAVRHKGFIPWDEDLDIAIDRKDRDKVIRLLIEAGFKCKPFNDENSLLEVILYELDNYVVHIDIMGYQKIQGLSSESLEKLNNEIINISNKHFKYNKKYHQDIIQTIDNFSKNPEGDITAYVRCVDLHFRYPYFVVESTQLFPLTTLTFEGNDFKAPAKYAEYLTSLYKDYMQWPPFIYSNEILSKMSREQRINLINTLKSSNINKKELQQIGL